MNGKKADFIYVERIVGAGNDVQVQQQIVNDRLVVHITQMVKENRNSEKYEELDAEKRKLFSELISREKKKHLQKTNQKLIGVIRKFWCEETIVVGDEALTKAWGMPNELFRIKRELLLENAKDIVRQLGERNETNLSVKSRASFLLVIDSIQWRYQDVEQILWQVQRQYEDIYVISKAERLDMEKLEDYFVEECGVVLQQLSEKEAQDKWFDTIFFFVERDGGFDKAYSFGNRYLISEWEENRFQTLLFVALNDTINNSIKKCD